jgi:hypothetical protein
MPGGSLHWPIWSLYEIYMRADYLYGWKALDEKNGFTSAQGFMNIPESLLYFCYLYLVFSQGTQTRAILRETKLGFFAPRYVNGKSGALAAIVGFTAAVMTFNKTSLYGEWPSELSTRLDQYLRSQDLMKPFPAGITSDTMTGPT